jgi:predicted O-methyltransferase YrrM
MWRWEQIAAVLEQPLRGAELGVKEGRFTEYMLRRFPELHMIAVDLWEERHSIDREGFETYKGWNFDSILVEFNRRTEPYADRLSVLRCDTCAAAREFEDGTFDFVFIDAEHTYEGVRGDIQAWLPKLRPGGLLSGHDYCKAFPGVRRAVDELNRRVDLGGDKVWMIRV